MLKVLEGNRRNEERKTSLGRGVAEVAGKKFFVERIERDGLSNSLILHAEKGFSNALGNQDVVFLSIYEKLAVCSVYFDDYFRLRIQGEQEVVKITNSKLEGKSLEGISIEELMNVYDIKRYALLDSESFSNLLLKIKDCPINVNVYLRANNKSATGAWDFSDFTEELQSLTVELEGECELAVDEKVRCEFNFLGTNYFFYTCVQEFDSDFGMLGVDVPLSLVARNARVDSRRDVEIPVDLVESQNKTGPGVIRNLSFRGAEIIGGLEFDSLLEVIISSLVYTVDSALKTEEGWRVIFSTATMSREHLFRLNDFINQEIVVIREGKHYERLGDLYNKVGYLSSEEGLCESRQAWSFQDEAFPGSMVVGIENQEAIASYGTLPISKSILYGHSGCMVKTLQSAYAWYKCFKYSFSFSSTLKDFTYYAGSFSKESRFVTNLFLNYENQPKPHSSEVIHTNQILRNKGEGARLNVEGFVLKEVGGEQYDSFLKKSGYDGNFLKGLVDPYFEVHTAQTYQVMLGDNFIGYFVKHTTPPSFTASDIFSFGWLISNDEVNSHVIDVLVGKFGKIQVVNLSNTEDHADYDGEHLQKPAFFTLHHVDDLSLISTSIAKSVYKLLVKYGESSDEYLKDVMQ